MGTLDLSAALRLPWRAASEAGAMVYRGIAGSVNSMAAAAAQALERVRQRRDLQALDDRMLKDIGLSRSDAEREGRRPFWVG